MPLATIKTSEKVLLTMLTKDAKGNTVPKSDPIGWTTSQPSILRLLPNGMASDTQFVAAIGPVGVADVTVTDGKGLTKTVQVEVVVGPAVSLDVTAGTPSPA
jgi:hypothetical protein